MDSNILLDLVKHADDKHMNFTKICFWSDYIKWHISTWVIRLIIKDLKIAANKLFNSYCKAIKQNHADINMLLAYKQLHQAVLFYEEELQIIRSMLIDYEDWLADGNFFDAFVWGKERY
jgi:uncharacterized protein YeeX (DUF496 family)